MVELGLIHLSDATEGLRSLADKSVDLILTDPAYSSLEKWRGMGTTTRLSQSKSSSNEWFQTVPNSYFDAFFVECYRVLKKNTHLYVMCDAETFLVIHADIMAAGFGFKKPLIWKKVGHAKTVHCPQCGVHVTDQRGPGSPGTGYPYRSVYEMVYFAEKGKRKSPEDKGVRDVLEAPRIKHKAAYPTEKPIEILQVMIKQSTKKGDLVVDPFAGSGATLQAAMRLGRKAIGFDLSEKAIDHYKRNNTIIDMMTNGMWF